MKKRTILRLFFTTEIILFSWFYWYGPHGMQAVAHIVAENYKIEEQIRVVKQKVAELEKLVVAWQTNDFLKEKIAREQLQLAREGEEIYCIND